MHPLRLLGALPAFLFVVNAQTFNTIHYFNITNGGYSLAGLVQATNGELYGTTSGGGAIPGPVNFGYGTIFKIGLGGKTTTVYNFCSLGNCADGAYPTAGLIQATNGDLYGTTYYGGINAGPPGDPIPGGGTVFKITPNGTLTTLYSFCAVSGCADGGLPWGGLIQAANGDLYGTTWIGGANAGPNGAGGGTIFKITPSGSLTTLYSFCSQISQSVCTDGMNPWGSLLQAANGNLYGVAYQGGVSATTFGGDLLTGGTIFSITPTGTFSTLYRFCSQANLYGRVGFLRWTGPRCRWEFLWHDQWRWGNRF